MLQSEVQAVTITKTIRKGKRLLPGQSYLSNPTDSIIDSWLLEAVQQLLTQDLIPPCRVEQKRLQLWFEKPA
ncbi:hypothetical protein POPTR_016G019100v4 [Populus trichocarpa]|uniref:Uncharacterized protein n=1 Tax=Populus trichocarpa TaxID=3694 RepID=A0ACC0RSV0_POPTR|nr:hypothetical protein POPTR_016G019100v4 [Populus trichocarpa]